MLRRVGRFVAAIAFLIVTKWLCGLALQSVSWPNDFFIARWAETAVQRRFDIPASTVVAVVKFLVEWGPSAVLFLAIEPFIVHKLDSRARKNPASPPTEL